MVGCDAHGLFEGIGASIKYELSGFTLNFSLSLSWKEVETNKYFCLMGQLLEVVRWLLPQLLHRAGFFLFKQFLNS